jgi:Phage gp6-like head-tail connector protein
MTPNVITSILVPPKPFFAGQHVDDLVSLTDVKEELEIKTRQHDAWLKKKITSASLTIKHFCNRTFPAASYHEEFFPFRDAPLHALREDLLPLQLSRWPVANVPSPAGIEPPAAPTLSAVSGGSLAAARYYVRATYVTAQGETPASLEADIDITAGSLPQVASPVVDRQSLAIGWNCYIATAAGVETLQNSSPLAIGESFTLPASGLFPGPTLPNYLFVAEAGLNTYPLGEGRDFLVKAPDAQLLRRHPTLNTVRSWPSVPAVIEYRAGYTECPDDISEACLRFVVSRWFARKRDPNIRNENTEGVYSASYWLGTGPGGPGDLPVDVAETLNRYRVPVIA